MPSLVRSVPATFTGTFPPTRFQTSNVPPLCFFLAIASRSTTACPVTLPLPTNRDARIGDAGRQQRLGAVGEPRVELGLADLRLFRPGLLDFRSGLLDGVALTTICATFRENRSASCFEIDAASTDVKANNNAENRGSSCSHAR